jgi:hypothetical protein
MCFQTAMSGSFPLPSGQRVLARFAPSLLRKTVSCEIPESFDILIDLKTSPFPFIARSLHQQHDGVYNLEKKTVRIQRHRRTTT